MHIYICIYYIYIYIILYYIYIVCIYIYILYIIYFFLFICLKAWSPKPKKNRVTLALSARVFWDAFFESRQSWYFEQNTNNQPFNSDGNKHRAGPIKDVVLQHVAASFPATANDDRSLHQRRTSRHPCPAMSFGTLHDDFTIPQWSKHVQATAPWDHLASCEAHDTPADP